MANNAPGANQIPALPPGLGGDTAAPLVTALNDRLRRISTALGATAAASTAADAVLYGTYPVLYGTHLARVNAPVPADATIYFETDRSNVAYEVRGTGWVWLSGTMNQPWASLPADLGTADTGFLFADLGSLHIWQWTGAAWAWGPGDRHSGEMAEFDASPGSGWQLCDGSGSHTKYSATATRVTTFTVPDRRGFYTEGSGSYTGTGVAAVAATVATTGGTAGTGAGAVLTAASIGVQPVPATFATLYYYRL